MLPATTLPTSSVTIGGDEVTFRSLSRHEAMQMAAYKGREDEAEDFILSCATGCTVEEAAAWRASTDLSTAGILIDAVLLFSGLAEKDAEGNARASTRGR
jgi:hypothetical protein